MPDSSALEAGMAEASGAIRDSQGREVIVLDSVETVLPSGIGGAPVFIGPQRSASERVLSTFQSGYTRTSGTGVLTLLDTTQPGFFGSGALKVVTPSDGTATNVRNSVAFSPAWDLTGKQLKALIRTDTLSLSDFKLYLSSDSFVNFAFIDLAASGATYRPVQAGEWAWVTFDFEDMTKTGTPVRSAITNLQWKITGNNGTTATTQVAALVAVPAPASGVVSLTFDDGWLSQYTRVRAILDNYGLPATGYLIADVIDNANPAYCSLAQLQELQELHAWDFACHAATVANHNARFDTLGSQALESELQGIRAWMARRGFVSGIDHFALPLGAYAPAQLPTYRKFFQSVRTISGSVGMGFRETYPPANALRLRSQSISDANWTSVAAEVTKAIANKEWLILCFHDVIASGTASSIQITQANFDSICANIASQLGSGLACRTVPEQFRQSNP